MAKVDAWVHLSHVEHSKKSYTRRVLFHHPNDKDKDNWFSVPLTRKSDFTPIAELEMADWTMARHQLLASLKTTYKDAEYLAPTCIWLEQILESTTPLSKLKDLNIHLIESIAAYLEINPTFVDSSTLDLAKQMHVNLELCQELKASTYISGKGARKYQDQSTFDSIGVALKYSDVESLFTRMNAPAHLKNKSILAWMMHYSISDIKSWLHA